MNAAVIILIIFQKILIRYNAINNVQKDIKDKVYKIIYLFVQNNVMMINISLMMEKIV